MEDKIKLLQEDVAKYYWLDDVTFMAEFNHIPDILLTEYGYSINEILLLYAEYWEEDDSFHYVLELKDDYIKVNRFMHRETNWMIRALAYNEED